tara:strand:+ start:48 stop:863 length:816 start_codon:yes stop_codon:yes gene_type:complete
MAKTHSLRKLRAHRTAAEFIESRRGPIIRGQQDPQGFDGDLYHQWRRARLDVMYSELGKDFFKNKKVLEAGAAMGHVSTEIKSLGAKVTAAEARQENIDAGKVKFPNLNLISHDFDQRWTLGKFDVIVHFGLLYHLLSAITALEDALDNCDVLVLETVVSEDDCPEGKTYHRDCYAVTEAYNYNLGPSEILNTGTIEEIFRRKNFRYKRIVDAKEWTKPMFHKDGRTGLVNSLGDMGYKYYWDSYKGGSTNDGQPGRQRRSMRRFWIAQKN